MPLFIQLFIIVVFLLLGKAIVFLSHIPITGSVVGMITLLCLLLKGVIKLEWIEKVATFQIKHLTLLFIPLVIGVFLSPNLMHLLNWNFIIVLIVSSICCLLGTAYSVEWFEKIKRGRQK
jgi:holin-like protein